MDKVKVITNVCNGNIKECDMYVPTDNLLNGKEGVCKKIGDCSLRGVGIQLIQKPKGGKGGRENERNLNGIS